MQNSFKYEHDEPFLRFKVKNVKIQSLDYFKNRGENGKMTIYPSSIHFRIVINRRNWCFEKVRHLPYALKLFSIERHIQS